MSSVSINHATYRSEEGVSMTVTSKERKGCELSAFILEMKSGTTIIPTGHESNRYCI